MANRRFHWHLALIAATLLVTVPVPLVNRVVAQDSGLRSTDDRGNRFGRGGRRGGGRGGVGRDRTAGDSNRPTEARTVAPIPAATSSSNSFGTMSEADKIRKWASDTMAEHDKSGNRILEGDELSTLGQSARSADLNGDGKITLDELVQNSMPKTKVAVSRAGTQSSTVSPNGETTSSPEDLAKRKLVNTTRKSYRFKTTKERMPLWRFASKDANGDGQVSMSEYARSWTDRTAAAFQRYDKDNDGMITPEEAK